MRKPDFEHTIYMLLHLSEGRCSAFTSCMSFLSSRRRVHKLDHPSLLRKHACTLFDLPLHACVCFAQCMLSSFQSTNIAKMFEMNWKAYDDLMTKAGMSIFEFQLF
jgi:hypothetical protein